MGEQTETAAVITSANVLNNLVSESSLIIREFFRAAMGSPILAITASLIVSDILEKKLQLISSDAGLGIKIAIGALVGGDITAEVLGAISGGHENLGPQTVAPTYVESEKGIVKIPPQKNVIAATS